MQNIKLFLITIVATLVLIAGAGWFFARGTAPSGDVVVEAPETELAPAGAHTRGATESAQFTIVEFSDFQCPACKQTVPYVDALVNQYPDQVRLVYRHFPLSGHPNSDDAARAAEAAAVQDKFWPMHDVLFAKQDQWSGLKDPRSYFIDLAKEMGLDEAQFVADLDGQAVRDVVERDRRWAETNHLPGTPSFFLNGKKLDFADVRDQIQTALGK